MKLHTCTVSSGYDPSCEACRAQHLLDHEGISAPIFPQPMTWRCGRCGGVGVVGSETHRCDALPAGAVVLSGPCRLCGDVDYAPSLGGEMVCPACDAGNFHDDCLAMKRMMGLKPPPTANERRDKLKGTSSGGFLD